MSFSIGAALQHLLPQRLCCRFVYRLAHSRRPWLAQALIDGFRRLYDIDLAEAAVTDPRAYASFNAFFTRELMPGARPLAGDDKVIVSPADGRLTEFGRIDDDRLLQAKGRSYTSGALLAEPESVLAPFRGGSFLTIYLAPRDYHRVHAPLAGQLGRARYIPGRAFSVNAGTAASIEGLFCRNERAVLWLASAVGDTAIVMVGALNVASLTTVLSGEIVAGPPQEFRPEVAPLLARGEEVGRFNLGSTVVLLFPAGAVDWLPELTSGQSLRMGQAIGRIRQSATG